MTDWRDSLDSFRAFFDRLPTGFADHLSGRLAMGEQEYGRTGIDQAPGRLVAEGKEECIDLFAYCFFIAQKPAITSEIRGDLISTCCDAMEAYEGLCMVLCKLEAAGLA